MTEDLRKKINIIRRVYTVSAIRAQDNGQHTLNLVMAAKAEACQEIIDILEKSESCVFKDIPKKTFPIK